MQEIDPEIARQTCFFEYGSTQLRPLFTGLIRIATTFVLTYGM